MAVTNREKTVTYMHVLRGPTEHLLPPPAVPSTQTHHLPEDCRCHGKTNSASQ
jgi:hypothetical protein